nr:protein NYNRIN-like [Tanacetum cinerariifolium]
MSTVISLMMTEVPENTRNVVGRIFGRLFGQPQNEANTSVLYISGTRKAPVHSGGLSRGTPRDHIGSTPASIVGSTSGGPLEVIVETPRTEATPSAREQIKGYLSALRSLLKEHNGRGNMSPIRLSFKDEEDRTRVQTVVMGKEIGDDDMKRPFTETRIISVDSHPHQTLESGHPGVVSYVSVNLRWKDPTEITMIVRKANETLVAFKERWIEETGFITGVPELMKISSFMDAHKCPELAKRFFDKVPKIVDEMMTRRPAGSVSIREDWFHMRGYGIDKRRNEGRNMFNPRDGLEILASEPQLNLQPPRLMQLPPKKETQDKYCKGAEGTRREGTPKRIRFPPLLIEDASDDPLIIEAIMEGYLVSRDWPTIPSSGFLDNTLHGKVPYPKRGRNLGHPFGYHLRMPKFKEEANDWTGRQAECQSERVDLTEQTPVNPAYLDQLDQHEVEPQKCSFGVEEGKFLGYMVTSEGIRGNPKKTKAITDMQSPRTLKEMQSLSRKLAALKRFLSRSAEKSLPFFETLKDITKENKDEYQWTENAKRAFQEMKSGNEGRKCRIASRKKGVQCPIHYQGGRRHTPECTTSTRDELHTFFFLRSFREDNRHDRRENQCLTRGFWCTIPTTWGRDSRRDLPRDNPLVSVEVLRGKLIQKLLLNQKCMGYLVRAYYIISPTSNGYERSRMRSFGTVALVARYGTILPPTMPFGLPDRGFSVMYAVVRHAFFGTTPFGFARMKGLTFQSFVIPLGSPMPIQLIWLAVSWALSKLDIILCLTHVDGLMEL